MARSPRFKIYDSNGKYWAACKEPEAAAAVVSLYGDGATIRDGHSVVVWKEGNECQYAGVSYDYVALVISSRTRHELIAYQLASSQDSIWSVSTAKCSVFAATPRDITSIQSIG